MRQNRLLGFLPFLCAGMFFAGAILLWVALSGPALDSVPRANGPDLLAVLPSSEPSAPSAHVPSGTPSPSPAAAGQSVTGSTASAPLANPSRLTAPGMPAVIPAVGSAANEILAPLILEVRSRRTAREAAEPQVYARRVDGSLNQHRINFLVYGYGITNEPPLPPQYKGSIAVYSLDLRTLQISTVTLNHDIRAPEVERFLRSTGREPPPTKIHLAYPTGGFDLMRLAAEDATGLSVDFQLAFQDALVKHIVDDVVGGLLVDVPFAFEAEAIYFEDVKYPPRHYARGRQQMSGIEVLQFIKAIQQQGVPYDARKELAIRKQIIVQALLDTVKQQAASPLFWAKMIAFLKSTLERKEVEYDFDAATLLFNTMGSYISYAAKGQALRLSLGRSLYVVDAGLGDGGVEWVRGSANPIMINELKQGIYAADKYLSVPTGLADPYAPDLPASYWTSVRQLVRLSFSR